MSNNEFIRKIYAAYAKDLHGIRLKSSSGGIFAVLAQNIIEKNGIVYGVIFDHENQIVRYSNTDEVDLIELMRSKYVAAEMGDVYSDVLKQLDSGRLVMFAGTPCGVAGLKKLVQIKFKKIPEQLLLVDFLCEGVPSPQVFSEYIKGLEKKYREKVVDVIFRSKEYGWNIYCMKVVFQSGKTYIRPHILDTYMDAFIMDLLFNRPCCYECQFRINKESDITLADFWKADKVVPEWTKENFGVSAVFLNSQKGKDAFKTQNECDVIELSVHQEQFAEQHLETQEVYEKRNKFFEYFISYGYDSAITKFASLKQKKSFIERLKKVKYILKLHKWHKEMRKILDE